MNMSKKKILLVEDDTNLGNLLLDSLEIKNYDVTLKRNGEEGLTEFKNGKYDMCIFDVMMPKKDGFTLAKMFEESMVKCQLFSLQQNH
jgi:DNA-binding response OmpR family regulator